MIADSGWYGVFIDQFGFDYDETRERQNEIVDYAHSKGLKCIANAWDPEEAMGSSVNPLGNPDGIPSHLGEGDYYLSESFFMSDYDYRSDTEYLDKYLHMKDLNDATGVKTIALTYKKEDILPAELSDDKAISYILAQTLNFSGWWFTDDLADNNMENIAPTLDIGTVQEQLHKVSDNKYVALTDKYEIEYNAGYFPSMRLRPLDGQGQEILLGTAPPEDMIDLNTLSTEEATFIQQRLNAYGYQDDSKNYLTVDGSLGAISRSVLNKFLQNNGFQYYSSSAQTVLYGSSAINAEGGIGLLDGSDFSSFDTLVNDTELTGIKNDWQYAYDQGYPQGTQSAIDHSRFFRNLIHNYTTITSDMSLTASIAKVQAERKYASATLTNLSFTLKSMVQKNDASGVADTIRKMGKIIGMTGNSVSNLELPDKTQFDQAQLNSMLMDAKRDYWDGIVNLDVNKIEAAQGTGSLLRVLGAQETEEMNQLDQANQKIVDTLKGYWQAQEDLDGVAVSDSLNQLQGLAGTGSISTQANTKLDDLNNQIIQAKIAMWVNKGNETEVAAAQDRIEESLFDAEEVDKLRFDLTALNPSSNLVISTNDNSQLDIQLQNYYNAKVKWWDAYARNQDTSSASADAANAMQQLSASGISRSLFEDFYVDKQNGTVYELYNQIKAGAANKDELIAQANALKSSGATLDINALISGTGGGDSSAWRQKIADEAQYWIGKIPYCIDGIVTTQILDRNSPPPYMDCSDFTSSVYKTVVGIDIGPNTSTQIGRGTSVSYSDLKPGDLIFFDWGLGTGRGNGVQDHVGIYIGNGQFIHETGSNDDPSKISQTGATQNVKSNNLNDNWGDFYGIIKDNICGIRRIIQDNNTYVNIPSEKEKQLPGSETTQPPTTSVDLGKPIETIEEMRALSDIDIVARAIYGEQTSADENAQEAVAWTMINRRNEPGQSYYGKSYKDIVLAPSQYTAMYKEGGNINSYKPNTSTDGWKKAVELATKMINEGTRNVSIANPIGNGTQYRATSYFEDRYRVVNGQDQYLIEWSPYNWVNIKDIQGFSGNTFFNFC